MGNEKARHELSNKFEENNPTLYGQNIKIVAQETYLGEELGISVSDSVSLTIKKRTGLVKKSIYEIKTVVEDLRSKVVGGIKTGIQLWESCVIPFLLYNSSTWVEIKDKDLQELSKLQRLFLNTLLGVKNCPGALMLWDLGVLDMPMRIWKEKLILYHHIACLPETAVAHQMMKVQEDLHFPSLRDDLEGFLAKFEVHNVNKKCL